MCILAAPRSLLRRTSWTLVLVILVGQQTAFAQGNNQSTVRKLDHPNNQDPNVIDLKLGFVMLIDDVDVPASQSGILKSLGVREGDYVNLNDEVASVDDQVARQQLSEALARTAIAEKKAANEIELKAAKMTYEHAHNEYQREKRLVDNGAGSQTKADSWLFEARKALAMIDRAEYAKQLAELDKLREQVIVKTAEREIERHAIRTPINGNVFEVYQPAGSWVNAGDKVLRVIRMNTLRVQGFVDAGAYDRHQVSGKKVTVTATLARGRKVEFDGTVTYVGLDEHAGNRFMVWAEVKNKSENGQWILVPNDEVSMKIHLDRQGYVSRQKTQSHVLASDKKFKSLPAIKPSQFSIEHDSSDGKKSGSDNE